MNHPERNTDAQEVNPTSTAEGVLPPQTRLTGFRSFWHHITHEQPNQGSVVYSTLGLIADGVVRGIGQSLNQEILTGYGHDVLFPVQLYFGARSLFYNMITHKDDGRFDWKFTTSAAGTLFVAASAAEVAQKYGFYQGTYDPADFLAYGIGCSLAAGLDYLTFGRRKLNP